MSLGVERGPTPLDGMEHLRAQLARDERGAFTRLFDAGLLGFTPEQISRSDNRQAGTLRGLHFQAAPHEETKVVQVISGRLWDVAVDLRPGSTHGQWHGLELGPGEGVRLAPGLAHGFLTLEDETSLLYFMDEAFAPRSARGYRWDSLGIEWPCTPTQVSARDLELPPFA
ncbi:MAG: dTDP-4-dehydrorhamnose 3,5-epimerase family protein [Myxococcota bacterium]